MIIIIIIIIIMMMMMMMMITIMNLIYIVQFDTHGILIALYTVIKYIQTHHMSLCVDIHIYTYTDTC